jgi:hypothetical protein
MTRLLKAGAAAARPPSWRAALRRTALLTAGCTAERNPVMAGCAAERNPVTAGCTAKRSTA